MNSTRLLCVRYTGEEPLFEQAGRCPVRLEMGGVDQDFLGIAATFGKFNEDAPEHAQLAPSDEAVVDCLVWPVAWRNVTPPQPVADYEDDPTDHPAIIHPGDAMRERKERRYPRHLGFGKQDHFGHGSTPFWCRK